MQGFNMGRYVPPEHEGVIGGNKLQGKHALGKRAAKISSGILVVRFEMPFATWCTNCQPEVIIGQGVRFNAEKKKVGNYYSSPIFEFTLKHTVCGGKIVIRTDPKNSEYVVGEGGRKRDYGGADKIIPLNLDGLEDGRDALEVLEGKTEDERRHKTEKEMIDDLLRSREKDWADPYQLNQRLRQSFRVGRNERKEKKQKTEALKDRFGLELDLADETEMDRMRAGLVEFENVKQKKQSRRGLQKQLIANTRAVQDPFLQSGSTGRGPSTISTTIKRKRGATATGDLDDARATQGNVPVEPTLVDYDTD
jgi:coiled-coil domain-containing protein 130